MALINESIMEDVMPGKSCGTKGHRKHTPITSRKQQQMMGAELRRREAGQRPAMKGMKTSDLRSHLSESKGKKLPYKA